MGEFRLDFLHVISFIILVFCLFVSAHTHTKKAFKWWWREFRSMTQRHRTAKRYIFKCINNKQSHTHSHTKFTWKMTAPIENNWKNQWRHFSLALCVFIKTSMQTVLKWELIYVSPIRTLHMQRSQRSRFFHEFVFLFCFVFANERNLQLTVIKS